MSEKILVYFGNSENSINSDCYKNPEKPEFLDFVKKNIQDFELENLVFAKQTHGTNGLILTNKSNLPSSWSTDSDYLITDLKNIGIGVLTADCLPIIIVDDKKPVIAIIHAGWRGAVSGIIEECVNSLINNFDSKPENLKAYLGPCAKVCCYEVQQDFVEKLPENIKNCLLFFNNKIYFNLSKLAQLKLENLRLNPENINLKNNICTMCNPNLCSSRLDKSGKRQISLVMVKD